VRRVLQEGVLVAVIGAALAFGANALSSRGLILTKDYFPGSKLAPPTVALDTNLAVAATAKTNSPLELLSARLRENGLQLADSNQVAQFFHDPRREVDGVIFIDARDDEHYRAGHIPGAYHFDRFHPENYITNVLQVCLTAQQIVFYCNGGDCDDSEHAAIMLRDSIGISREKVFVYGGGINEWTSNGLPLELGARNSGEFTNAVKSAAASKPAGATP
jgi:rhodanese-related sulfurtransferase